jgi:hypothetical protein
VAASGEIFALCQADVLVINDERLIRFAFQYFNYLYFILRSKLVDSQRFSKGCKIT